MASSLAPPPQIGTRYRVLEQLGRGGMAVVYRVFDTGRDEEVALKQLQAGDDPERRRQLNALFEREFYVLAQLTHPSVVQVYDFGLDDGGAYYTMELLDGGDLDQRAPLPARTSCELTLQVCSALSLLHSRGFIHRDIGPRNVRCTRDGRAKLIDFGALIPMGPTRQVVGTPAFTAPEAIQGLSLDARTDLFSLGATLYFALTARAPFAVRVFDDLRVAWRQPPIPPSELAPDVSPELDALVLSLLRVDPEHRPRSTSEIIQRLAAIGGSSDVESAEIVQAYLQTPTLVGRDEELAQFRAAIGCATQGAGSGIWLEAAPGGGRSRLLDAWVLEAKTHGLAVVRSDGRAAGSPFSSIYELCERALEALPEHCLSCAHDAGVFERLFETGSGRPELMPLAKLVEQRDKLPQALSRFLERIGREHALCIVVDDAERVDEPSLAILASLVHAAPQLRALLALSVSVPLAPDAPAALSLLAKSCRRMPLQPLSLKETEVLFGSVFGGVPNLALVSDRIYTISVGNPRAAMSVAQHMLDRGLIRYAQGSWLLPPELTLEELPPDAEHLLRARVANLSLLARRLAELQALAIAGQFSRADFAEFAGREQAAQVDRALDELVRLGLFATDGVNYTLAHRGDRALLLSSLTPETCRAHHLVLAQHFATRAAFGIAEVHHWLAGDAHGRALDRLPSVLEMFAARSDIASANGMASKDVAATLERAFEISRQAQRPEREQQALIRMLVTLAVATDNALYERYAGHWFERLERDSGLADYRALDPELPAPERLKHALDAAAARYQAAPEDARVYRVDEAIRHLARYVTISIAIGARTRDAPLMHSLGGLLAPFASLTPLLHALWLNAVSAHEMNFLATIERARARALSVYEELGECQGAERPYAELVRKAIASALASIDTGMGAPSANHWLEMIENDPLQSVNAMYLRRLWCIVEGDRERAEHYRMRAEVLALQSNVRQMFMPPVRHELLVQIRAGDLAGVKQCADQMARLAEGAPGWKPLLHLAMGSYQRMRGDLALAQLEFERSLALCGENFDDPASDPSARVGAAAGYVGVLAARGRAEEACAFGRTELARCEASGMRSTTWDLVRELALAEAKLGEHEQAARRIDALIELREGALPAHRIADYEARVRVAVEAKDLATLQRYMLLLAAHTGAESRMLLPRHLQLSDDARRAGLELEMPETRFQTIVLAPRSQLGSQVTTSVVSALAEELDRSGRAQRALELLCQASPKLMGGVLYIADASGLTLAAELGGLADLELAQHVGSHWLQLNSDDDATTLLTQAEAVDSAPADGWQRADGRRYRPILLRASTPQGLQRVGLAVLVSEGADPLPSEVWELAAVLGARLVELGDATGVSLD